MGYFTGAITINPPLNGREIRDAPNVRDVRLRVQETATPTDDGEIVTRTADAIVPTCDGRNGYYVVEEVQVLVDHAMRDAPGRVFAGFIEAGSGGGEGGAPCARYVVRDGPVETVTPRLVWPGDGEADELGAAQTKLARVYDVLAQLCTIAGNSTTYSPGAWRAADLLADALGADRYQPIN